jgi:hypothetical protein
MFKVNDKVIVSHCFCWVPGIIVSAEASRHLFSVRIGGDDEEGAVEKAKGASYKNKGGVEVIHDVPANHIRMWTLESLVQYVRDVTVLHEIPY